MASCSRGTCGAPAVAGLAYDNASLSVWMFDLHADMGQTMSLCQRHIQNFRVPKDWTVSDERDGTPRLWTVVAEERNAPTPKRGRVRRQRAQSGRMLQVEELQLFELETLDNQSVAPVASLDDARNHPRHQHRSGVHIKEEAAPLLG